MASLPPSPPADQTHPPPLRPRLIARLNERLSGKLTLVSTPAGYGETTLVARWLSRLPAEADSAPLARIAIGVGRGIEAGAPAKESAFIPAGSALVAQ